MTESLIKAIEGAPKFLTQYVVGFIVLFLTDVGALSLLLAAVVLGFATFWWVGVLSFLVLYSFFVALRGAASIVAGGLNEIARAQYQTNEIYQGANNASGRESVPPE